jgi:hypothetical protein
MASRFHALGGFREAQRLPKFDPKRDGPSRPAGRSFLDRSARSHASSYDSSAGCDRHIGLARLRGRPFLTRFLLRALLRAVNSRMYQPVENGGPDVVSPGQLPPTGSHDPAHRAADHDKSSRVPFLSGSDTIDAIFIAKACREAARAITRTDTSFPPLTRHQAKDRLPCKPHFSTTLGS